jgi:hypothetical protein
MDEARQHAIFRRRREPAQLSGVGVGHISEPHQPLSLGAAILMLTDRTDPAGASVVFGKGETLSYDDCVALKRRYKDELLLDDAAHGDRQRMVDGERSPGSGTGPGS